MIHRLCSLPLSIENYNNEYEDTVKLAERNGYRKSLNRSKKVKAASTYRYQNRTLTQSKERYTAMSTKSATCTMHIVITNKLCTASDSTKDEQRMCKNSGTKSLVQNANANTLVILAGLLSAVTTITSDILNKKM